MSALKIVVLRRDLAVCYAGDVGVGLRTVREVAASLEAGRSTDEVMAILSSVAQTTHRHVEFIVARCGTEWQLARIVGSRIDYPVVAHIGDDAAFERFQEARAGAPPSPSYTEISAGRVPVFEVTRLLRHAMEKVIGDPTAAMVGNFLVPVACEKAGLSYMPSTISFLGEDVLIPSGEPTAIPFAQTVSTGAYTASLTGTAVPGLPAMALCFPHARFAMLFLPLQFDEFQIVHVQEGHFGKGFVAKVREEFGVVMAEPFYVGN